MNLKMQSMCENLAIQVLTFLDKKILFRVRHNKLDLSWLIGAIPISVQSVL